jgi:hypothetical protein
MSSHRLALLACLPFLVALMGCRGGSPPEEVPTTHALQLNQGWSHAEASFYQHANEGTNLAPRDFLLNLPDPFAPDARFLDRLTRDYGFIPSPASLFNPDALPVGLSVDERPEAAGDRSYVGITCAACHTRQMTYSPSGSRKTWTIAVHGGPGIVDIQRFNRDLYDAFLKVLDDDRLAHRFARGVLGREPRAEDVVALRTEIGEFIEPVVMTRAILADLRVAPVDAGPGNLNALSQGHYNNLGLMAWMTRRGYLPATAPAPPPRPGFEGSVSLPPMWFAIGDTWAQWFAEIHDAGPRNWIQSVSTSPVRPPRMAAAINGPGVMLMSIHFDNIAEVQRLLGLLRPPQWSEEVFGALDRRKVDAGAALYAQHCAECHTRSVLPPNDLGVVFKERVAFDVGTDPTAYQQFAADVAVRGAGLKRVSDSIVTLRRAQLTAQFGEDGTANHLRMYSRGRPDAYALATDHYRDRGTATWPKSGAAYWAPPLEGIFATSPYLHNGSVRTLADLLTRPADRPKAFRTGSSEFEADVVGLRNDGGFLYDTTQPGKGNGGHPFGTELSPDQKTALLEYLKAR